MPQSLSLVIIHVIFSTKDRHPFLDQDTRPKLHAYLATVARPAGSMNPRALIVFKHDSQLGNAPSHKLFELVSVKKKESVEVPRAFTDYEVTIDRGGLPTRVEIIERI